MTAFLSLLFYLYMNSNDGLFLLYSISDEKRTALKKIATK